MSHSGALLFVCYATNANSIQFRESLFEGESCPMPMDEQTGNQNSRRLPKNSFDVIICTAGCGIGFPTKRLGLICPTMAAPPKFRPHPQSAPGDFYVVHTECLACGMPHVVAPDLVGWAEEEGAHCIWKKQPQTPPEIDRAIAVLESQDLECHRYAGTDRAILDRVPVTYCDHPIPNTNNGNTVNFDLNLPKFTLINQQPSWIVRLWKAVSQRSSR